ncbi:prepilin peptidase [Pelagibacteraceae bacterium]|nr:prepilin peptidase [Pelagibacteraceae bacterium]
MLYFFNFYIGAIVGSFIYVCVLRLPKNEDVVFKKSYCEICSEEIKWLYNIPLLSFLWLRGKSNCCQKKINLDYFIIELITGLFFLINFFLFDNFKEIIVFDLLHIVLLIIIFIDYKSKIIFDIFSYSLVFTGLIVNYFFSSINPFNITIQDSLITVIISSGLFGLLKFIYKKIKKIDGLGGGDIILIAGLTAWTGFIFFLYLLILSSLTGIIYYYLFNNNKNKNFEIPFGSSLGLSFIILIYYSKIFL